MMGVMCKERNAKLYATDERLILYFRITFYTFRPKDKIYLRVTKNNHRICYLPEGHLVILPFFQVLYRQWSHDCSSRTGNVSFRTNYSI